MFKKILLSSLILAGMFIAYLVGVEAGQDAGYRNGYAKASEVALQTLAKRKDATPVQPPFVDMSPKMHTTDL